MKRKLRSPGETPDEAEGGVPVGTILDFAGVTPPSGYLLANGAAVSRSEYSKLFAVLDIIWGAGDGLNTFNLPNAVNKFMKGKADTDSVGSSGGTHDASHSHSVTSNVSVANHTLIEANLPSHAHTINHSHSLGTYNIASGGISADHYHTINHTHSTDGNHHHDMYPAGGTNPGVAFYNLHNIQQSAGISAIIANQAGYGYYTTDNGSHNHGTFSGTSGYVSSNHTHTTNIDHSHSLTGSSSGTAGSGTAVSHSVTNNQVTTSSPTLDNRPEYITVNKIIKY